ncbi:GNAT family N-acetyltransferase [Novosphingobium album (ex Hu et al. 2023)]|uniref:GNAT family N-acetyltransferase n=1 Tax=Novosphingobium album (ex Hu et al. 2023) TaxID=2930093 RepID=A0ABT0B4K9_9SPHN|nr:GNAT family N-acetyltransferase [Novosphingobium album (ex Hu et al. 2023)]MCJ2179980.1 GNAT family N-acetyltransferase [Novosphingobium album (ex Hu et al. 2023)]
MDRQPVLEGDRLVLRPLVPEDWDALFAVASDPQIWARHPAHDRWQEPVFRQFFADAFARGGALAIVDRDSGEIIGSSQFDKPEIEGPGQIEIGWSFLARAYWGKGYNAEFKRMMLAHALAHYPVAIFQVGEDNVISRRAMENIGGVLTDRTRVFERGGTLVRHVIYEITREGFAGGPLG